MPDQIVRDALLPMLGQLASRPQGGLKGLGLICRVSQGELVDVNQADIPGLATGR